MAKKKALQRVKRTHRDTGEVVFITVEELERLRDATNASAKRNKTRYFHDIYTIEFEGGQIPEPPKEELVANSDESEKPQQSTEQEEQ